MRTIYERTTDRGYIDLIAEESHLIIVTGFRRAALGVNLELPAEEQADLAEALLRHLDEPTRLSVVESVLGKHHAAELENNNP